MGAGACGTTRRRVRVRRLRYQLHSGSHLHPRLRRTPHVRRGRRRRGDTLTAGAGGSADVAAAVQVGGVESTREGARAPIGARRRRRRLGAQMWTRTLTLTRGGVRAGRPWPRMPARGSGRMPARSHCMYTARGPSGAGGRAVRLCLPLPVRRLRRQGCHRDREECRRRRAHAGRARRRRARRPGGARASRGSARTSCSARAAGAGVLGVCATSCFFFRRV